jgi:hypothetical protein
MPMPLVTNKWNTLISGQLNPSNGIIFTLTKESINELVSQSEVEQEAVRSRLIEGILDKTKISDKHQYVQLNQAILIRLLDKLYSYKQDSNVTELVLWLYNTVSQHLENTLDFIEDFFGNYFDRNEKVPAPYLLISIEELCRQLVQLQSSLKVNKAISANLATILVRNFDKFCQQKTSTVTYNELMYQKDLMNELLAEGMLQSEENLKVALFYFNFNDHDYIAYLYGKMKELIDALSNRQARTRGSPKIFRHFGIIFRPVHRRALLAHRRTRFVHRFSTFRRSRSDPTERGSGGRQGRRRPCR